MVSKWLISCIKLDAFDIISLNVLLCHTSHSINVAYMTDLLMVHTLGRILLGHFTIIYTRKTDNVLSPLTRHIIKEARVGIDVFQVQSQVKITIKVIRMTIKRRSFPPSHTVQH